MISVSSVSPYAPGAARVYRKKEAVKVETEDEKVKEKADWQRKWRKLCVFLYLKCSLKGFNLDKFFVNFYPQPFS